MPRISRFKRRLSDRSGFKYYEIELVKQTPAWKVHPDEFDQPPLSRLPLGGEGEVSPGEPRINSAFTVANTETPAGYDNPVVYITAAGGIVPNFTHPWMYVTGSNQAVTLSATPQIAAGRQGQVLTLQCVDSAITLSHGNGVNLMTSAGSVQISSGMVVTFFYTTGGSVWNEVSRNRV